MKIKFSSYSLISSMPKVNYDEKSKILNIRLSNKKSVDSDAQGNVVVDYDKEGKIVNIDIMKISLEEFSKARDQLKELLKSKEKITV